MTLPRTQDFAALVPAENIPSDGAMLVAGDLIATDKDPEEWGLLKLYGKRDVGLQLIDSIANARSWFAYMPVSTSVNYKVSAPFFWQRELGDADGISFGLMARLVNVNDGASPVNQIERWFLADCYSVRADIDPVTQNAIFYLRRTIQGVTTVLAGSAGVSFKELRVHEVDLQVSGGGATVQLFVHVNGVLVVNYSDTHADRITAAGRYGFLLEKVQSDTGANKTRVGIKGFKATTATNAVMLEDDFSRPSPADSDSNRLRRLWHRTSAVTMSNGRIEYTTPNNLDRVSLYQVRPYRADYNAKVRVTFPNGTSAHWMGVAVRASGAQTGSLFGFTGYLVRIRADSNVDNLEILKYLGGTLIHTDLRSITVATGVDRELRVDVFTGPDYVRVQPWWNGAAQTPYFDRSASRLQAAGLAGLYLRRDSSGSGTLILDSWQLVDGAAPTVPASIPLSGEIYPIETSSPTYVIGKIVGNGTNTVTIPHKPKNGTAIVVWDGSTALEPVTSGTPTAEQVKVTINANDTTLLFNASIAAGRILPYEAVLSAGSNMELNQVPSGTQNGVNTDFTLPFAPADWAKLRYRINGFEIAYTTSPTPAPDEFTNTSATVARLGFGPPASIKQLVDIPKTPASDSDPVMHETPIAVDSSRKVWRVANMPRPGQLGVSVAQSRMTPGAGVSGFVLAGDTFTLGQAAPPGIDPLVDYMIETFAELVLTAIPSLKFDAEPRFLTREVPLGLKYRETFPVFEKPRWLFHCSFDGRDQTEYDYLIGFLRARKGPVEQFKWTPPDIGAPIWAHVVNERVPHGNEDLGIYRLSFDIEELYAAA